MNPVKLLWDIWIQTPLITWLPHVSLVREHGCCLTSLNISFNSYYIPQLLKYLSIPPFSSDGYPSKWLWALGASLEKSRWIYLFWYYRVLLLVLHTLLFDDTWAERWFKSRDCAKGSWLHWSSWSEPSHSFFLSLCTLSNTLVGCPYILPHEHHVLFSISKDAVLAPPVCHFDLAV